MKTLSLPELPSSTRSEIEIRRLRRPLPSKLLLAVIFAIGVAGLIAVGLHKLKSTDIKALIEDKIHAFIGTDGSFDTPETVSPESDPPSPEQSLPVGAIPEESSPAGESAPDASPPENVSPDTESTTEETKKEPCADSEKTPVTGVPILSQIPDPAAAALINKSPHQSDLDISRLTAMTSSVIKNTESGPLVLVIHTHTSEGYISSPADTYDPESDEITNGSILDVGRAFATALEKGGIECVHITYKCDKYGSTRSYIESRAQTAAALAKYPTIKYVIDIHRSLDIKDSGELLRQYVPIGSDIYAPIGITVNAGAKVPFDELAQNASLALAVRNRLGDLSPSLALPVLSSDAVGISSQAPRSLKIDVGGAMSTLEEATRSATLLGELFSLLLGS